MAIWTDINYNDGDVESTLSVTPNKNDLTSCIKICTIINHHNHANDKWYIRMHYQNDNHERPIEGRYANIERAKDAAIKYVNDMINKEQLELEKRISVIATIRMNIP